MILGVIADDFTGATDVAGMLVRAGMRTVQTIGVPEAGDAMPEADAVVVALKSRTAPADEAVRDSLAAAHWLRAGRARQIYFKVCSTFDSTPQGNIGPVADALLAGTGAGIAIACPAFPENGRTVYRGHLFVGDLLLSDTGMRNHPLTPMTDASLVRVLQAQSRLPVGLVRHDTVSRGADAVRERLAALHAEGARHAIADALDDEHLRTLAEAVADAPLLTAGSGVALGLPAAYARRGWLLPDEQAAALPAVGGSALVLSGSCSEATQEQVRRWIAAGHAALRVDPLALAEGTQSATSAALDAVQAMRVGPVLVYATAEAGAVRQAQQALGTARAGELVEACLAEVATLAVADGARRVVVAGGETSGAVVRALGVRQLRIGPTIDPGVPWTMAEGRPLLLALKSGNFGRPDFFTHALAMAA
jgi:uncharacterized protein YgbK (DUF1537 family)